MKCNCGYYENIEEYEESSGYTYHEKGDYGDFIQSELKIFYEKDGNEYNTNAKIPNVTENVCINERNKQNTVYSPTYFKPFSTSFMCEAWLDIEDEEK